MKLYDVVICDDTNGKVVSIIGKNLNEKQMERRIETGLSRIDTTRYHVKEVEAGTAKVES